MSSLAQGNSPKGCVSPPRRPLKALGESCAAAKDDRGAIAAYERALALDGRDASDDELRAAVERALRAARGAVVK